MEKHNKNWNLNLLFSNQTEELDERDAAISNTEKFAQKWKGREDYLNNEFVLKEALDDYEEWHQSTGPYCRGVYYHHCRYSLNQNDSEVRAEFNKALDLERELSNEVEFFCLSLGRINSENQKKFLSLDILADYRYLLERIFLQSKHFLSEQEERIMTLKEATAYDNWVMMNQGLLSKEERNILGEDGIARNRSFEEIMTLISSKNKDVRDSAALALNDILDKLSDVSEIEINSILQNKKINDSLRGFMRPDEGRHLGDGIESSVVDALVSSVQKRFDISERFYKLKANVLGVDKLSYHERNVEVGEFDKDYRYGEAFSLVKETLSQLDPEFGQILDEFNNNGQIDVFPRKGKHGGAFCNHSLISHPTYILLNYTDKLNDVLTLAHEVGHGINNELMKKNQKALNFGSSLAIAEVASTFMEDFILDRILEDADDELKFSILMHKLGGDISTIHRQVACYSFEQELHQVFREKGYLSKEEIGKIFSSHMSSYMGQYVEQSPGSHNWWIYWSHIRTYFYVYSYASGLLIAKALQKMVKENPSNINKVRSILSAGLSKSPKDIFIGVGIDIQDESFWESGLSEIDNSLEEVKRLAQKLGKV